MDNTIKNTTNQSLSESINGIKKSPIDDVVSHEAIRQLDELTQKLDLACKKQEKLLSLMREDKSFSLSRGSEYVQIKAVYYLSDDNFITLFDAQNVEVGRFPSSFAIYTS